MAELLRAHERAVPDGLVLHLQGSLPEDYVIVADPTIAGYELIAMVVGPTGLWAIPFPGQFSAGGPEPSAEDALLAAIGRMAERVTEGLHTRLAELLPQGAPLIRHLLLLERPPNPVRLEALGVALLAVTRETLASTILSAGRLWGDAVLDATARAAVSQALCGAPVLPTTRASEPFLFRSGRGRGETKAWTIQELVATMDRNPDDALYHLRNGTVARWLEAQGAWGLANLARELLRVVDRDPYVTVERFLIGSGLVARPSLVARPALLDFGHILSGAAATQRLRVEKGAGRGYLFGEARPGAPWVQITPSSFSGALDAIVTVRTEELLIREAPYEVPIIIDSNASEEPAVVRVRFRVEPAPTAQERYLVRPLLGGAVAGGLGLALALALAAVGPLPALLVPLVALLWAVWGVAESFRPPPAWPVLPLLRSWLPALLGYQAAFAALALAVLRLRHAVAPAPSVVVDGAIVGGLFLLLVALIRAGRSSLAEPLAGQRAGESRRASVGLTLLASVSLMLSLLLPRWLDAGAARALDSAQQRATTQSERLERRLDGVIDWLYLRYYDHPTPAKPAESGE